MNAGINSIQTDAHEIAEQFHELEAARESLFYCPDHANHHLIMTATDLRCPVDYAAFAIDGLGLVRR